MNVGIHTPPFTAAPYQIKNEDHHAMKNHTTTRERKIEEAGIDVRTNLNALISKGMFQKAWQSMRPWPNENQMKTEK